MFGFVSLVAAFYFRILLQKENVTINTGKESLEKIPLVDLNEKKFILIIRTFYPDFEQFPGDSGKTLFPGQESKFLTLILQEVFSSKDSIEVLTPHQPPLNAPPSASAKTDPYEYQRYSKFFKPCSELQIDLTDVNHSENDLKDSLCYEFTTKTEIGGDLN